MAAIPSLLAESPEALSVSQLKAIQQPLGWATIADDRLLEDKGLVWPKMRTQWR